MSALWTSQQREWLQAMGHQVWALGGAQSIEAAVEAAPEVASRPGNGPDRARREAAALLRGEAAAPQARPARGEAAPQARPAPRPAAGGDRLLAAVLRAAGRQSGDADVAALVPDPAALRGNAAAKRALWPNLRALRRRGGVA